ncbi:hypothetical protein C3B55_00622 [Candidatus Pseudomonas adelgestsugas]|uniref:Uncharacterized protein n=1 Tax=Candidatus Pseudomonas adelgestsugas TaxID=1302376 RepID=A0ABX5R9G3_9PSED|nr:hypothetical protein C3B55_00622 [Candidatus Pseudomonas adelgestsugas]
MHLMAIMCSVVFRAASINLSDKLLPCVIQVIVISPIIIVYVGSIALQSLSCICAKILYGATPRVVTYLHMLCIKSDIKQLTL